MNGPRRGNSRNSAAAFGRTNEIDLGVSNISRRITETSVAPGASELYSIKSRGIEDEIRVDEAIRDRWHCGTRVSGTGGGTRAYSKRPIGSATNAGKAG